MIHSGMLRCNPYLFKLTMKEVFEIPIHDHIQMRVLATSVRKKNTRCTCLRGRCLIGHELLHVEHGAIG